MWCFDGEFVVDCVVIVDRRQHTRVEPKNMPRISTLFLGSVWKTTDGASLGMEHQGTETPRFFTPVEGLFSL
jgi:hypothetical protein